MVVSLGAEPYFTYGHSTRQPSFPKFQKKIPMSDDYRPPTLFDHTFNVFFKDFIVSNWVNNGVVEERA